MMKRSLTLVVCLVLALHGGVLGWPLTCGSAASNVMDCCADGGCALPTAQASCCENPTAPPIAFLAAVAPPSCDALPQQTGSGPLPVPQISLSGATPDASHELPSQAYQPDHPLRGPPAGA